MYLTERLKPEHKAKLEHQNFDFPLVVEEIWQELETKTKVCNLTYGTVMSMKTLLSNYNSPYELFNEI
jgi:hypothetical protein